LKTDKRLQKVLVIGLGEVGRSLKQILDSSQKFKVYGYDIASKLPLTSVPQKIDIMYICYPCKQKNEFIETTTDYILKFKPKLTVIHSTVPPNTTKQIYELIPCCIVHSPVRGMLDSSTTMVKDILFWTKYVGGATPKATRLAKKHFKLLGLKIKTMHNSTETELAKLFETIYRAWMIACFQEMHRITMSYNGDFNTVLDMMDEIQHVDFNKPLHYPDVIKRHCLIPNTELLLQAYPSPMLELILRSNDLRKIEITDKRVKSDVAKVKRRVTAFERERQLRIGWQRNL
jgi:UDP-N-acetyl-D-mannosaminuronate dehydrogenase